MSELKPFAIKDQSVTHAIIEIFGGDNNLNDFVTEDLQEIASGNQGTFSVLALADYANRGGVVIELSPRAGNRVVDELGEINTGDPEILANFIARALITYGPKVRKAIGFWDHGSGVFDENDPDEIVLERRLNSLPRYRRPHSRAARKLFLRSARLMANPRARAMLHDDTNAGVLTNLEAEGMLRAAYDRAGVSDKVDLIFSDTCLNGMIEVTEQLKSFASCIVGSEELEPGDGWDYHEWLTRMTENPPASPEQWATQAVDAFGAGYANRPDQYPCTLAAFRAENSITQAFAALVKALTEEGPASFGSVLQTRATAQSFTSDKDTCDLKDFVGRLGGLTRNQGVRDAAQVVVQSVDAAAIRSVALGPSVARAHGLAFWCPASVGAFNADVDTYSRLAFDKHTGWSEYLRTQFAGS